LSYHRIHIKHYVDLNLETNIHEGKCRCDALHPNKPCDKKHDIVPTTYKMIGTTRKKYVSFVENDGISNQIIALKHACYFSSYQNRYVILPETFSNHMQSDTLPEYEVKVCDILDCEYLGKHCNFVKSKDFYFSGGNNLQAYIIDKVNNSIIVDMLHKKFDSQIIHFKNKEMFQLGLVKPTWNFADVYKSYTDPIKINDKYIKIANSFTNQHTAYNSIQIRTLSANDYKLGGSPSTKEQKISEEYPSTQYLLTLPPNIPVFVLSSKCEELRLYKMLIFSGIDIICSNTLEEVSHPYENLIVSQLIAARAQQYIGLELSTITQIVYRWRSLSPLWLETTQKDLKVNCNPVWCKV
tara:strand:+ start:274 stop:1332 length:1059 start_codon:yes stop_codon:yes gene_type:complete